MKGGTIIIDSDKTPVMAHKSEPVDQVTRNINEMILLAKLLCDGFDIVHNSTGWSATFKGAK